MARKEAPVQDHDGLAGRFETHRAHLRAVAYRMLGSPAEADDAVQEAWLRLSRADTSEVQNLGGWLTTVVARVCLDMLRSRTARREEPLEHLDNRQHPENPGGPAGLRAGTNPEHEALLADSVGLALQVVLAELGPAERVAFVLHDMFAVPFGEIGPILGRSPNAAKQLASRARRRAQGTDTVPDTDLARQREAVRAFLAASRHGDFDALLAMLDPDVLLRADQAAVSMGAPREARGAAQVAGTFSGRAQVARLVVVNGVAAAVWAPGGEPRVVFAFTITRGKISRIDMTAEPELLSHLDVAFPAR
jgi:RNA polymerase sigma factor (sigma-70 family)